MCFSEGFLSWKWKKLHVKIFRDSEIAWYSGKGDSQALGKVRLNVRYIHLSVSYTDCIIYTKRLVSGLHMSYNSLQEVFRFIQYFIESS